jgi:hypothetical protein
VALARGGDWKAAHEIAQGHEGDPLADWLHGVVHRMEGDLANARYWYRRCGRTLDEREPTRDELERIAEEAHGRQAGGSRHDE